MKKNKLFFQIDLGVFPSIVFIAIGYKSIQEVMNRIGVTEKELDDIQEEFGHVADTYCLPNGNCCLLFSSGIYSIYDLTVVNHEVMHVVQFVMDYYDIGLNEKTSEVYAYTSHYIFDQIVKKFKETKLCLKK